MASCDGRCAVFARSRDPSDPTRAGGRQSTQRRGRGNARRCRPSRRTSATGRGRPAAASAPGRAADGERRRTASLWNRRASATCASSRRARPAARGPPARPAHLSAASASGERGPQRRGQVALGASRCSRPAGPRLRARHRRAAGSVAGSSSPRRPSSRVTADAREQLGVERGARRVDPGVQPVEPAAGPAQVAGRGRPRRPRGSTARHGVPARRGSRRGVQRQPRRRPGVSLARAPSGAVRRPPTSLDGRITWTAVDAPPSRRPDDVSGDRRPVVRRPQSTRARQLRAPGRVASSAARRAASAAASPAGNSAPARPPSSTRRNASRSLATHRRAGRHRLEQHDAEALAAGVRRARRRRPSGASAPCPSR